MKDWFNSNLMSKLWIILVLGSMAIPFYCVSDKREKRGPRTCLFAFVLMESIISLLFWVYFIVTAYIHSDWWTEQISKHTKKFGLPE